jgi:all-trans-8'-apo-beta-carotenal 15,15'-oxygenase
MNRRGFLNASMVGALAGATPGLLRAAIPEKPLADSRWLVGWQSFRGETLGLTEATIEGRWPGRLAGTLYRNGPGLFERAGFRYQHWFDGDGLMRAWRIADGRVTHLARMVGTEKFKREEKAGRFVVRAAGTVIPDAAPLRNNDDLNTANTAVIRIGSKVLALWEGGSAIEIDPDSLATRGPVTWREDLTAAPFSAHPLLERDGSAWNFGTLAFFNGSGLLIWRIGADGKLLKTQIIESPEPGYLHAFAMSNRYLVFMLMPFDMVGRDGVFFENIRFATQRPCRIAVVPKDALDAPRWFEADFTAAYHFGDAFELGDEVIMRTVRHSDPEEARSPMRAAVRGETGDTTSDGTDLANLHLDLRSGRAQWRAQGVAGIEFPTWDERTPGDRAAVLYAPCSVGKADAPYFNGVMRIDAERGRVQRHRYGAKVFSEEHRFVPKPGSQRAGEGWLLGTVLDWKRGRSGLAVLDAERVSEGPLATAWVPWTTPLGFHGWFAG